MAPDSGPEAGRAVGSPGGWPFLRTPLALKALVTVTVLAALVLPFALEDQGRTGTANGLVATLVAVLLISVANVEIGRLVEGGRSETQRPHKALSAWSFLAALLMPLPYLLPVVALSYLHARWRGLRIPLWKWVGSASYVLLAGLAAGVVAQRVSRGELNYMHDNGGRGLAAICLGAAVFLVVETVLFHGSAYLNDASDEEWLRATLAGRSFYVTEASVLLMGGLSAAVWTAGAWFEVLLVPVFVLAQRAALNEPLRQRADNDDKTGLLRFESWRGLSVTEKARCEAKRRSWSVAFADLDHFKGYNDAYGHLAGDAALVKVADVFRAQLRSRDLIGRFGGEEFCVFLPDTVAEEARTIAERLVVAVGSTTHPDSGARTTISVGVVTFGPGARVEQFIDALTAADRALLRAKLEGRDRVVALEVGADDHDWLPSLPVGE